MELLVVAVLLCGLGEARGQPAEQHLGGGWGGGLTAATCILAGRLTRLAVRLHLSYWPYLKLGKFYFVSRGIPHAGMSKGNITYTSGKSETYDINYYFLFSLLAFV